MICLFEGLWECWFVFCFDCDGEWLISGVVFGGKIVVWDVLNGEVLGEFKGICLGIIVLVIKLDNCMIFVLENGNCVVVWMWISDIEVELVKIYNVCVEDMCLDFEGKFMVIVLVDKIVGVWVLLCNWFLFEDYDVFVFVVFFLSDGDLFVLGDL